MGVLMDKDKIEKAKGCLRHIQNEYRLHDTNAIDVMYSLATEALAELSKLETV
jgi:hypothetical protein